MEKCPACGGPPGAYRLGACSWLCERSLGTPTDSLVEVLLAAGLVLAVLVLLVWTVMT